MRYLMTILLFIVQTMGFSQETLLTPDTAIAIPKLNFSSNGDLIIKASPTSSSKDFNYLIGNWKLKNRKLKSRLTYCNEWIEFESKVEMHQILDGNGNIDKYTDTASGKPYEGVALRLFNLKTRLWSIYWADNN